MRRPYFSSIWKKVGEAIRDYDLVTDGDVLGVGVSGGKDSLVLTWVLATLKKLAPVKFEVKALMVDMGWPIDTSGVQSFCSELGVSFSTRQTNIWPLVFEERREENPCALCAHLRRGALNALARQQGCNKVALAHHLDDAIETLLMSMFFEGRLEVFSPKTYLEDSEITVIRPLVYVEEQSIVRASSELGFPVIKSPCPAAGLTKRQEVKDIISVLSGKSPNVRSRVRSCLQTLWSGRPCRDLP